MLNNNIILLLLNYLKLDNIIYLYSINKYLYNIIIFNIPKDIKINYCKNKLNMYPDKLLEYFDPIKLYKIKNIDIKDETGFTDYIDFITEYDFGQEKIIKGIDIYKRPFIAFKCFFENKINCIILFQRFSNYALKWVSANDYCIFNQCTTLYMDESFDKNIYARTFSNLFNDEKILICHDNTLNEIILF